MIFNIGLICKFPHRLIPLLWHIWCFYGFDFENEQSLRNKMRCIKRTKIKGCLPNVWIKEITDLINHLTFDTYLSHPPFYVILKAFHSTVYCEYCVLFVSCVKISTILFMCIWIMCGKGFYSRIWNEINAKINTFCQGMKWYVPNVKALCAEKLTFDDFVSEDFPSSNNKKNSLQNLKALKYLKIRSHVRTKLGKKLLFCVMYKVSIERLLC